MHSSRTAGAWAYLRHQYSSEFPYWLVDIEHPSGMFGGAMFGKAEKHAAGSMEKLAKQSANAVVACRRAVAEQ